MKDIVIAGASRSGKSTLARMLNEKFGYYVLSIDKLVAVFGSSYPSLDIRLNWNRDKTTENIAPFLGHFMGMFSSPDGKGLLGYSHGEIPDNRFILEGAYIDPAKIAEIVRSYGIDDMSERFHLIGLVQKDKDVETLYRDFRQYDTENDWTYKLGDEELRAVAEDLAAYNQEMYTKLTANGFTVYDTSRDREKVFEEIIRSVS